MAHSYEEVRQFAQELPEEQRLLLANALWGSTAQDNEAEAGETAAVWDAEIARRVEEIKSGRAVTATPETVAADLREIVGQ
jgi:putative addiction module component (TIGR02574 family)